MPPGPRQSRRELVGFALLIGIIAVCTGIFFLDTIRHALQKNYNIVAVFREAPRLRKNSIVWVAGSVAGRVTEVRLLAPSRDTTAQRVAAILELSEAVRPLLRRDSRLKLASPRLMAEPVIEIDPGTQGSAILGEQDTLRAYVTTITTAALMDTARIAKASLDSLMRDAAALRKRLGRRSAQMARVQREAALASADMDRLQSDLQHGPLTGFMNDPERSRAIARIQANASAISSAVAEAQQRASSEMADAAPARARLMRHVSELRQQLTALQAMMNDPDGVYGRMQQDSALTKAVHGAQAQLDSLMRETRKNPLRFWF